MDMNAYEAARAGAIASTQSPRYTDEEQAELKKAATKAFPKVYNVGDNETWKMLDHGSVLTRELDDHNASDALSIPDEFNARNMVMAGNKAANDAQLRHRDGDTAGASTRLGEAAEHYTNAARIIDNGSAFNNRDLAVVKDFANRGVAHKTHQDYVDSVSNGTYTTKGA